MSAVKRDCRIGKRGAWALVLVAALLPHAARAQAPAPATGVAGAQAPVRFLVVASQEAAIAAATPGRIARLPVNLGDAVRAGQIVAAFDCDETQARRAGAEAELAAARLQHEAKAKLQGLDSAAELEVELAAANVNRASSQVQIFSAQLEQCVFRAPFGGRVARVHVKQGQGVVPGTALLDLVGSGAPKARLNVPSAWLAWLKPGATLSAVVDETASRHVLKVTRVAARVDAVSQTVEIEAVFATPPSQVLPGMSGQAQAAAR